MEYFFCNHSWKWTSVFFFNLRTSKQKQSVQDPMTFSQPQKETMAADQQHLGWGHLLDPKPLGVSTWICKEQQSYFYLKFLFQPKVGFFFCFIYNPFFLVHKHPTLKLWFCSKNLGRPQDWSLIFFRWQAEVVASFAVCGWFSLFFLVQSVPRDPGAKTVTGWEVADLRTDFFFLTKVDFGHLSDTLSKFQIWDIFLTNFRFEQKLGTKWIRQVNWWLQLARS